MAKLKRVKADHRADTRGKALSGLPHVVQDASAYLSLPLLERAVLAEVLRLFHGYNNGQIAITYERIGERLKGANKCRLNNGRIARAIARLIEHGLLAEPTLGSWLQRRARTYRITFISSGKGLSYKSATNDYLDWSPRQKSERNAALPDTVFNGDGALPAPLNSGDRASPAKIENGGFPMVVSLELGNV